MSAIQQLLGSYGGGTEKVVVLTGYPGATGGGWVVPAGVTSLQIEAVGRGSDPSSDTPWGGGGGGYARTNALAVTPGQTLYWSTGVDDPTVWARIGTNAPPTNSSQGVLAEWGGASGNVYDGGRSISTIGNVGHSGGQGGSGNGSGGTQTFGGGGGSAMPTGAGRNGGNGGSASSTNGHGGGGGCGPSPATGGISGTTNGGAGGAGPLGTGGGATTTSSNGNGQDGANGGGGSGARGTGGGGNAGRYDLWTDTDTATTYGPTGGGGGGRSDPANRGWGTPTTDPQLGFGGGIGGRTGSFNSPRPGMGAIIITYVG